MTTKKTKIIKKAPVESPEATVLKNRPNVVGFLLSNTDLIPVLNEAKSQLEKLFGPVPYYISLEKDPDEGFEVLFIVAKINKSPDEALSLRDKFGKEWFIPYHSDLLGRLNLDTELV
jgi:hypothetical protein